MDKDFFQIGKLYSFGKQTPEYIFLILEHHINPEYEKEHRLKILAHNNQITEFSLCENACEIEKL